MEGWSEEWPNEDANRDRHITRARRRKSRGLLAVVCLFLIVWLILMYVTRYVEINIGSTQIPLYGVLAVPAVLFPVVIWTLSKRKGSLTKEEASNKWKAQFNDAPVHHRL